MHELSVMESILNVVLRHARRNNAGKVLVIHLRVGELTDLVDEWMQHYFNYLSRETIAEGAVLAIERSPVVFRCLSCRGEFVVPVREMADTLCPHCQGRQIRLQSGREYYIKQIEVI